jgi:ATP-dependent Clp protease ATP-binding subunit ClpC
MSAPVVDASQQDAPALEPPPDEIRSRTVQPARPQPQLELDPELELELDPERFPLLTSLGRNLSEAAARGELDRVFGREAEIEQLLDVLARRRANNPVLVGPPGVGKTAIVEGLALRLAEQGDHEALADRVLVELSAGALLSGTGVRGALAQRLDALCAEVAEHGRIVLFIDEIHGVIGQDDGADSIANGLKTSLARGQLPCIGATTDEEYRRVFERDAALARRFTRVEAEEPAPAAALEILTGIAPEYEKHHGVPIDQAALEAAVDMSVRYVRERQLPDKAIALVDQAAARARRRGRDVVDVEAIAQVVAEQAAVPLERLLMRDGDALVALDEHLARRVVGQREPIAAVADALRKGAAGFRGARPLGTFLFLGPTGVGKTEMAKAISELLFPGGEPTRFDMSELSESHGVARLLGAPPGYLGHEEGGQLTESVRRRPYQLILLDEIEKAHRDVLLALLPLLDEGRLTDGRGRTVDFTNTIVVMTSNLGAEATVKPTRSRIGFGREAGEEKRPQLRDAALAAARAALPPELWNRIDEPLFFHPLQRDDVALIAERMLTATTRLMEREHGIEVDVEPSTIEALIAAGGYDAQLGARPMRRTVGRLVEAPLAREVLAGGLSRGDTVVIRGKGAQIVVGRGAPRTDSFDAAG